MKILIPNYTFDASSKTITFGDYVNILLENVLLITNVTDNIIIYNFAGPGKGGAVSTNVLTLDFDTTSMSDTDKLQIFYDDFAYIPSFLLSGTGAVTQSGTWNINNISGAISLPSGASTASKQDTGNSSLSTIAGKDFATETTLNTLLKPGNTLTKVTTVDTITNPVAVTGTFWQATQPVSVSTLPLPSGAATSANQTTGNNSLSSIDGKTPSLGQALAAASVPIVLTAAQLSTLTPPGAITGFATESTLSSLNSKVTAVNTGAVVISSSVLPTGAATAAKQPVLGIAGTPSADVITIQGITSMTPLLVNGSGVTQPVSGTFWQATQPISGIVAISGTVPVSGTFWQATQPVSVPADPFGLNADAASSSGSISAKLKFIASTGIPVTGTVAVTKSGTWDITNAGTFAVQATQSGTWNIGSITTLPALVASSATIGKVGIDQTTPGTTNKVTVGSDVIHTIVDSGSFTANAGTNLNTSLLALEAGGNLATVKTNTDNLALAQASATSGQKGNLILGAVTTAAPTYVTGQSNPLSLTTTGLLRVDNSGVTQPVSGTFWQATQPVSGTLTVNAGTNLNTSALNLETTQALIKAKTDNLDVASSTLAKSSEMTTQTAAINTLLKPASTLAAVTTVSTVTNLSQMGGVAISLNTGVRDAGTLRVTIATNDNVPVTGTFWQATQPISGTVTVNPLTNSSIVKAQLQDNAGTAVVLGQQVSGSSLPVVLPAAQITTLAAPVVTGSVTANAGTNLNTSALNLETTQTAMSAKLPATLGQKAMTASMAVVLASDQASVPVAATLSAETTKVIGTINIAASQSVIANAGNNLNTSALALESGGNLAAIKIDVDKIPSQGAAVKANSTPVNIASDQVVPVSASALPLPSGAATSANQTTEIASLANLDVPLSTRLKPADTLAAVTSITNVVHVDDNGGSLTVDGAVSILSIVPGTGATNLGKAEDSISADGDVGIFNLGVRQDVPSTDVSTIGDYQGMKTDAQGRLWINSDVLGNILQKQIELLTALLIESRIQTDYLLEGLNIKGNPDNYRNDPYIVNMY